MKVSRFSIAALLACLLSLLVACAEGDPRVPAPDAGTSATEPTEPSEPAPPVTPDKPKNPDEALAPEVDSVSPDKATVGSVGPSIIVSGNNFVPRSIVQLDGAPLATTFVSGTELRATIPSGKLATVGTLRISVGTSPPGGGASKEVVFQVENPAPQLTALDPLSVIAGAPQTTLTVTGSSFVSGAKIVFGTMDLPTTFVSASSLTATIPESLLGTSGSVPVHVVNPAPGGGATTSIAFTISNPSAAIQNINPSAAFVGSAPVQLTVNGGGFVGGSTVLFNGLALATTFQSAGQLKAAVPASSLGAAGDFPVTVNNPPPGGGVSAPVVFRVQYPAPLVSSVAPTSIPAGSGPTEITVTGVGFFITSQITINAAPAATTYVDATHLKATLSAAQLATAGWISVRVVNPAPGGGTSAAISLDVTNGAPAITSVSPAVVTAGSPDRVVTLYGTGFVPSSTVKSNGVLVSSTYVTGSQMTAVVPANQLVYPGSVSLTVTNPPPGGGTSAPAALYIGCDTSGVDVQLGPVNNVTTLSTSFGTAALMSRFDDASSCLSTVINPANQQPGRYWVVQNTAGVPVTLSAWAVCTASGLQDDAYLAFYRRPTAPATDTERLACTGYISEGIAESDYASPESGASSYCPGLTKANGGGLTLAVCEKAVVHIQAWSATSQTFPPPPTIRFKPE